MRQSEQLREDIYELIPALSEVQEERINKAIDKLAAYEDADVAPVRHGRWLTKEYMYGDPNVGTEDMWIDRLAEQSDYYAYCSICGKDAESNGSLILSDYCPNCGAKMDEEEENDVHRSEQLF